MKRSRRVGSVASVLTAATAAIVLAGSVAAEPLVREHYSFEESDTFTITDCGDPITIDFTVAFSGVFMLMDRKPGVRHLRISSTTTRLSRRSRTWRTTRR